MNKETFIVGDYMIKNPLCLSADMGILHAIAVLLENNISGAPVTDDNNYLVGMITERDVINVAVQTGYFDELGGSVIDYMSSDVACVSITDSLMEVAEKFISSPYRRYPVMNQHIFVGLITRREILQVFRRR